jgi:hypothetical protein
MVCALACACAKDDDGAKRVPESPPPPNAEIPADLSIPVVVDGAAADPVDAARLSKLSPDFYTEDHRAWKLTRVLGGAFAQPGTALEATGPGGVSISLRAPASDREPQPAIILNRRGDVAVAMVDPGEPFPDYHGRGGRLKRPGDPLPRVSPVVALRVSSGGGGSGGGSSGGGGDGRGAGPQAAGPVPQAILGLAVTVDGAAWEPWSKTVAALPPVSVIADGEKRPALSLRDIAGKIGPKVRLVELVTKDGAVAVDATRWADASNDATLRTNRRGTNVKFQWVGGDGVSDKQSEVRNVTELRFAK